MIEYNKQKNKHTTKKGSALAMALVMIVVVSIILTSLLGYITSQVHYSKDRVEREKAFQVAEAGVYYYRWYLAHEISGKTAEQIKDFWETVGPGCPTGVCSTYEADLKDPEGSVIGKYSLEITKPQLGSTIVVAKSTGWTYKNPYIKRVVQVRFRRPSWSENMVLANDDIRFGSGTTVNGKIHSNKGIRFDGVATNVVSSSLASYNDPDHSGANEFGVHTHSGAGSESPPNPVLSRPAIFQAGRQFPVAEMSFSGVISDISYMRTRAIASGTKFDNSGAGRRIILKADGTFDMCKVNSYSVNNSGGSYDSDTNGITNYNGVVWGATGSYSSTNGNSCTTSSCCYQGNCPHMYANQNRGHCSSMTPDIAIPNNGVIFVANNVWLEGTINNKRVSVVAAELSDEPTPSGVTNTGGNKNVYIGMGNLLYTNADGSDILGVIAQKDVETIRNSLTNLTIDAALLAKDGRVGRNYYDGITRSSITLNGALATNLRYGFAYTDGTGYQIRNLNFDNNLLYYPPPYFPTGTEYFIDQWDEL